MKLLGEYGLRGKREIWRVQLSLSKIRSAARTLLTLDAKDPRRIFEGEALLRRMYRYGLLVRHSLHFVACTFTEGFGCIGLAVAANAAPG